MYFVLAASIVVCLLPALGTFGLEATDTQAPLLSRTCLGCICEAASGCNQTLSCEDNVCGPFRITWQYWADAGKPSLNNQLNTEQDAYRQCVNDASCAGETVQRYMAKFQQDCNGDGHVNCDDFVRIHRLGGYGCTGYLNEKYQAVYDLCTKQFGKD